MWLNWCWFIVFLHVFPLWHSVYFCRVICHPSAWKCAKTFLYLHCCFLQTAFPNNWSFAVIVHVLITGGTCCQHIPCEKIVCDAGYYWMQLYAEKFNPNLGESFFFFLLLPKTPLVFWNSFLCKQFPTLNQIHLSLWWSLSWSTQIGFPLIFIFWVIHVFPCGQPRWLLLHAQCNHSTKPFNEGPLFFIWKLWV